MLPIILLIPILIISISSALDQFVTLHKLGLQMHKNSVVAVFVGFRKNRLNLNIAPFLSCCCCWFLPLLLYCSPLVPIPSTTSKKNIREPGHWGKAHPGLYIFYSFFSTDKDVNQGTVWTSRTDQQPRPQFY